MKYKVIDGGVSVAKGFMSSALRAGIRKAEKDDFLLIASAEPTVAAGVFTTNKVQAWCVQHNRERLSQHASSAIVCFAGNANACNGIAGKQADLALSAAVLTELQAKGFSVKQVLSASTGVIGRPLAVEKLLAVVPTAVRTLGTDDARAAAAIMTTDLVPKSFALQFEVGGKNVAVGGITKGSGMIAPNMATMLGFVTTDVAINEKDLQEALAQIVEQSFNRITVDGDTSTNDMVLCLANGASGVDFRDCKDEFCTALKRVCTELACQIARDGEGATKLVHVTVSGAKTEKDCAQVAKTIAESPLVKTACFGNDPNWGRILAAAGRSGVSLAPEELSVSLAGVEIFRGGEPTSYDPDEVSAKMKTKDLLIDVVFLGGSVETATVWTCDFSYDYVKINADYGT